MRKGYREAFNEIIKVVKAREAPKVNTTSASTQTAATYTTISMQTDFNLSSSTSYLTSGTQTNHLHTNSCPTMDCFVQTNPSSIQTSCHIINSSSLSPALPQVTATSSVSTTTMGIQTDPTTTQLLKINAPTCVATSQCPELPGNKKKMRKTRKLALHKSLQASFRKTSLFVHHQHTLYLLRLLVHLFSSKKSTQIFQTSKTRPISALTHHLLQP